MIGLANRVTVRQGAPVAPDRVPCLGDVVAPSDLDPLQPCARPTAHRGSAGIEALDQHQTFIRNHEIAHDKVSTSNSGHVDLVVVPQLDTIAGRSVLLNLRYPVSHHPDRKAVRSRLKEPPHSCFEYDAPGFRSQ